MEHFSTLTLTLTQFPVFLFEQPNLVIWLTLMALTMLSLAAWKLDQSRSSCLFASTHSPAPPSHSDLFPSAVKLAGPIKKIDLKWGGSDVMDDRGEANGSIREAFHLKTKIAFTESILKTFSWMVCCLYYAVVVYRLVENYRKEFAFLW